MNKKEYIDSLINGNDYGSKLMRKGYDAFIKEHPYHKSRIQDIWCQVSFTGYNPDYVFIEYKFCGQTYKYEFCDND